VQPQLPLNEANTTAISDLAPAGQRIHNRGESMHRITLGRLAASVLVLGAIVGTSAATSAVVAPPRAKALARTAAAVPATARLMAFGGRSAAQQRSGVGAKLDAALAGIARHTDLASAANPYAKLSALNPAAHFMVSPRTGTAYVAVDAITRGDPQALKAALVRLGLERPAVYLNDVGGWLPVSAIEAATAVTELHSMRAALSRTNTGSVTTQGDYVQGTANLRSTAALDGTGITVGILSDSYNCYATYAASGSPPATGNAGYASSGFTATASDDVASGDLPATANINILQGGEAPCMDYGAPLLLPDADEGRAMMQIVHDVAPGAKLAFHTAVVSEADFASGIQALASAGANIIADDVTYFDEPYFQDGLVAHAVDTVKAAGVAYFAAAGNSGANAYDNTAPSFATASTSPPGETLLNFDTTGATTQTALTVHIPVLAPGQFIAVVLQWDQPYVTGAAGSGGATSQMDLCLTGSGSGLISSPDNPTPNSDSSNHNVTPGTQVCTGANATGTDPYQILVLGYPANATGGVACAASGNPINFTPTSCSAAQDITIQVGHAGGTTPGRIKLAIEDNGAGVTAATGGPPLTGGTLQGHPGAAGAMAVGAAFWDYTAACQGIPAALLETFSAKGGDPILFDAAGNAQAAVVRQKPDIIGPDGGNDTFLGFVLQAGGSGQCSDNGTLPSFFGTSAATPHVAGAAALLMQRFPGINIDALYHTLRSTATAAANDTANGGINYAGNYGFIDAHLAVAALPAAPAITASLSPASVSTGASSTYTWSVTNASGCTASGAWSGAQALTGSMTVSQSATGTYDYTLTCVNTSGKAANTQVLTVTSSGGGSGGSGGGGGGGGGALDLLALLTLGALGGARLARRRC